MNVAHIEATAARERPVCTEKGTVYFQVARKRRMYAVHEVYQSAHIHLYTCLVNTLKYSVVFIRKECCS